MGAKKERKSIFLTAFEHREKEARSLFAAQCWYRSCLWLSLSSESSVSNAIPRYLYCLTDFTFWGRQYHYWIKILTSYCFVWCIFTHLFAAVWSAKRFILKNLTFKLVVSLKKGVSHRKVYDEGRCVVGRECVGTAFPHLLMFEAVSKWLVFWVHSHTFFVTTTSLDEGYFYFTVYAHIIKFRQQTHPQREFGFVVSYRFINYPFPHCLLLSFERVLLLFTASPPRYRGRCCAAIRLSHRPEQSGRAVCGGSMDWTVEDDMVDSLFCATLTAAERAIPHLYRQERKHPTPVRRRLSRTQALLGRVIPEGWVPVSGIEVRSLGVVRPLRVPLMIRPLRHTYVVVVRKTDELLCGGYKWVSRLEAPCSCTRWTGECWVEQVYRLHGTAS